MKKTLLAGLPAFALLGAMTAAEAAAGRYLRAPDGHAPAFGRKKEGEGDPSDLDIKAIAADFKKAGDEVKDWAEKANKELKDLGKLTEETKASVDDALTKAGELGTRLSEVEQKLARQPEEAQSGRKTVGQMVTEGREAEIAALGKSRGKIDIEVKAIISSLTTDADGSAGDLIVPQRLGMVSGLQRRMTIRDLLMPGRTSAPSIQYPKESGFTNSAATVSETSGAAKPQSEIKFDIVNGVVTTIAHWVLATKQILDDVPMLQSYIDGRLRYGLAYVEEQQLLNGGGTGTDLEGIYTAATAFSAPITPTEAGNLTKVDILRLALLQAELAELPADGIVLHPSDWADIELTKTSDGAYLFSNPQNAVGKRLWGRPVVDTQAMTVDKFLVGAFGTGAQIFDREDANVEISTEDSDNFRKNLVTIRAEERLALAIYRDEAFTKGDFSDALGS